MEYKDYYQILGIEKSASKQEIKRAYRTLARKYHPDVSKEKDAESKFKEIGEAYDVLKDPEKREAYDQLGSNWKAGQDGFQPPPDWKQNFDFSGSQTHDSTNTSSNHYSSFFEDLFGANHTAYSDPRGSSNFKAKGENIRAKIMIDLEDSLTGAERLVTLATPEINDQGHVINKNRTLNIKIPKGIKEGQSIRLSQQGNPGYGGGDAGDLLIEVAFNPHRLFNIQDSDISLNVPVAPWEATLGASITVPTPDGKKVELKIPPNSQQGRKLRLKGKGLPGKNAGDFYAILQVVLPPSTDTKVKEYNEKMRDEIEFNPRSFLF